MAWPRWLGGAKKLESHSSYNVYWPANVRDRGIFSFQLGRKPLEPFQAMESTGIYSAVSVIAQDVARLQLRHLQHEDTGAKNPIRSNLWRAFRRPNGYQSRADFLLQFVMNMLLSGNSFIWAPRNRAGRPAFGMHVRPPHAVLPQIDGDGQVFYDMHVFEQDPIRELVDEKVVRVPARDMLHSRLFCLEHPLMGMSPLRAATYPMFHGRNIQQAQTKLFAQSARPDGILSFKGNVKSTEAQRITDLWKERYGIDGEGGTAVVGGDATWTPVTLSAADAQLTEQYRLTIFDFARIYRLPAHMMGLTEQGGPQFNNAETLSRLYVNQCLGFWLEMIEASLDAHFNLPDDQGFEFDVEAALMRTDFVNHVEGLTKAVQGGIFTPNEARKTRGMGPKTGGDELYLQKQMLPLDEDRSEPDPVPPTQDEDADDQVDDELEQARAQWLRERLELGEDLHRRDRRIRELELELEEARAS